MTGRLIEFDSLASTNDYLAASALALEDGTWVRAGVQTAGRGRQGRPWAPGPGNLFASVLAKPRPREGPPQQLSLVAAVALYDAAVPFAGRARLSLKWPNDLMLVGGKCAGILLERVGEATVIGFGVNLASAPAGLGRKVSCLGQGRSPPPDAHAFCRLLIEQFEIWRRRWAQDGFAPVRAHWLAHATPVGWSTSVTVGGTLREGKFAGLADDGAMLLQTPQGVETIYAGDVIEG
ncbi:MAG: biotin--[acetyl-CoA-carboxylase] ligase [Sphingomonadaceae bacterium]|nr:biotin--[acetyl-CoA-carboxylase] ligase [Sphingomonadaceae bacterium]